MRREGPRLTRQSTGVRASGLRAAGGGLGLPTPIALHQSVRMAYDRERERAWSRSNARRIQRVGLDAGRDEFLRGVRRRGGRSAEFCRAIQEIEVTVGAWRGGQRRLARGLGPGNFLVADFGFFSDGAESRAPMMASASISTSMSEL